MRSCESAHEAAAFHREVTMSIPSTIVPGNVEVPQNRLRQASGLHVLGPHATKDGTLFLVRLAELRLQRGAPIRRTARRLVGRALLFLAPPLGPPLPVQLAAPPNVASTPRSTFRQRTAGASHAASASASSQPKKWFSPLEESPAKAYLPLCAVIE